MRILLVDPHFAGEGGRLLRTISGALPALGILSLASVLKREHTVAVLDCQFHSYDSATAEIRRFRPDLVAISATTPWIEPALRLARAAKGMGALVVLGGPHPTIDPEGCLADSAADAVVLGEAEETMAEFCRAVEAGNDFPTVRGMAFSRGGTVIRTRPRPLIRDLDTLPMHAWDLIPVERYMASSVGRKSRRSIALVTSRGCPWHCSFCSQTVFGHGFRARSPRLIIEEMRHLHDRHGKREFIFRDDVFIFPRKRIEEFCRSLIQEKMDIEWCCSIRPELVDRSLLALARKAGCYMVCFGGESGNDATLRRMNKQLTVNTIRRAAQLIRDAGLRSAAAFIIGFPGETERDILDTVKLATTLPVDYPYLQFFDPLPGTVIYAEAMRKGRRIGNRRARTVGLLQGMDYVPDTVSPEFLLSVYEKTHRSIYGHPRRILRYLRSIRSIDDMSKAFSAALQIWRPGMT